MYCMHAHNVHVHFISCSMSINGLFSPLILSDNRRKRKELRHHNLSISNCIFPRVKSHADSHCNDGLHALVERRNEHEAACSKLSIKSKVIFQLAKLSASLILLFIRWDLRAVENRTIYPHAWNYIVSVWFTWKRKKVKAKNQQSRIEMCRVELWAVRERLHRISQTIFFVPARLHNEKPPH